jgi:arginine decarboxylase-like protein
MPLALEQPAESLLVLNGFKDRDFVKLAFASGAGKKVVIVIEKMSELEHTLNLAKESPKRTRNRFRWSGSIKLYSKARVNGKSPVARLLSLA